jgi:hypothetical protein
MTDGTESSKITISKAPLFKPPNKCLPERVFLGALSSRGDVASIEGRRAALINANPNLGKRLGFSSRRTQSVAPRYLNVKYLVNHGLSLDDRA